MGVIALAAGCRCEALIWCYDVNAVVLKAFPYMAWRDDDSVRIRILIRNIMIDIITSHLT